MSKYLKKPVDPVDPKKNYSPSQLLEAMAKGGFQGKNLGIAQNVWLDMLADKAVIFMGIAGAIVPAGMRKAITCLIENRLIDCLVSTGANLFHDCHESFGNFHWQGTTFVDDLELRKEGIDRIYDVFAVEKEFCKTDNWIGDFAASLDNSKPFTTREFLYLLGKEVAKQKNYQEGILTSAAKYGVPIYCPALGDSSIGLGIAERHIIKGTKKIIFDIIGDIIETTDIVTKSGTTGVIYLGGGTPKNFIQQTVYSANIWQEPCEGHKYAIQITTDSPQWGGLSGCTFEEAQSWGKVAKEAKKITVHSDITLAFPLLVSGVLEKGEDFIAKRKKPKFIFGKRVKINFD
jgi:deoxyhypusine synthase